MSTISSIYIASPAPHRESQASFFPLEALDDYLRQQERLIEGTEDSDRQRKKKPDLEIGKMAKRSRQAAPPAPSGDRGKPIPVRFNLRNRFYEVLLFYQCLDRIYARNGSAGPPPPERAPNANQPDKWLFRAVTNKLAQLCDSSKGGDTVTAFAILNLPSGIHYVFGSNHRMEPALVKTRTYINEILHYVGRYSPEELRRKDRSSEILRKLLIFVRGRAGDYARIIHEKADSCIETCRARGGEGTDALELQQTGDELIRLRDASALVRNKENSDELFSELCERLIFDIEAIYEGPLEGFAHRPRHENSCWGDVRHATGRLLSYLYSIPILIESRKRWPQLFQDFEVTAIPSFPKLPNPLMGKVTKDHSAAAIIGRMTSEGPRIEELRQQAEELQGLNLDKMIKKEAEDDEFRPIVHAELVVHDWLIQNGHTHSSHFFQEIKYIGSSKPTCRLCQYYFEAHPLGFQLRETHRNFYPKWRAPDVFQDQGEKGIKDRERFMIKMLEPIREDTSRTIKEKVSERSRYDSNTEPTKNIYQNPHSTSLVTLAGNQTVDVDLGFEEQFETLGLYGGSDDERGEEADDEPDGGARL
ncbi:hypothetical protein GQ53DRAFT_844516 [Thozetella sp. PMI_491]|nr:hypothetical protein GQ53DRAFT_844516 [Thozetella sp. PMI_491]